LRVILKEDVENLGRKGDIVAVAPGYGRNYLIPKKLALKVTSSNMKMIEIERQSLMKKLEKEKASHQAVIQKLNQTILSFKRKAGEKDVIFGSVSSSDISEALLEMGIEVEKKKILLDEPIKRLGNFSIEVKIFHEDRAEIKVEVIKEEEKGKKAEKIKKEELPEKMKAIPEEKPEKAVEKEKSPSAPKKKKEGLKKKEKDKE
jgi:large subunit ribosomal protein L9